jgi:signal transduction histidine kinase
VAKHAQASTAEVEVAHRSGVVTLRVVDDGRGLTGEPSQGNGIRNLTERAAKLSGRCQVTPGPHGGTVLEWSVPDRA